MVSFVEGRRRDQRHTCSVVLHVGRACGQSEFFKHSTHVSLVGSQNGETPPPSTLQFMSERQRTQTIVVVSQYGVGAPHCLSLVHARTQRLLLQVKPASPQFVPVRHCTQAPAGEQ